ncbi:glycosyltransferase [Noviherbaspirillum autotrophicum]|uniref:Glycosyltransferase 2-like domain-containing protein n=1 Tax=Noviherbaspirillum autotrophicum TaxID=709839 RepID=A0A0C1YB09_9BURK|nr:glycosyltransferase [Noviherbaspirillum autotrophicum]KIF82723.1 hypothetical protein TSA66_20865 [Noviherbaspirillum autotrophicum]KIF84173.1 hypothetical protein TSA66_00135 [Noviherbaspirillum autotrophicum]
MMKYSVVMAAHRPDHFLLQAVRSVELAISDDDAELIVVANGFNRHAVVDVLVRAKISDKVRVEVTEMPSLIYALNRGIELARGEYIARFDADDICLPNRFRTQHEIATKTGADFIFSDAEIIDAAGGLTGQRKIADRGLMKACGPIHPTAFMRREALLKLGGYGNLEFSEDYHLWLRASSEGYHLVVDHTPVIQYRVHSEQATDKSKLVDTFATNIGIKLIIGMRKRNPKIFFGAAIDTFYLVYRKCRAAFS